MPSFLHLDTKLGLKQPNVVTIECSTGYSSILTLLLKAAIVFLYFIAAALLLLGLTMSEKRIIGRLLVLFIFYISKVIERLLFYR